MMGVGCGTASRWDELAMAGGTKGVTAAAEAPLPLADEREGVRAEVEDRGTDGVDGMTTTVEEASAVVPSLEVT